MDEELSDVRDGDDPRFGERRHEHARLRGEQDAQEEVLAQQEDLRRASTDVRGESARVYQLCLARDPCQREAGRRDTDRQRQRQSERERQRMSAQQWTIVISNSAAFEQNRRKSRPYREVDAVVVVVRVEDLELRPRQHHYEILMAP